MEKWDGTRSGVQAAQDVFNADEVSKPGINEHTGAKVDEAGDIGNILTLLSAITSGGRTVYSDIPADTKAKSTFTKIVFGSNGPVSDSVGELLQKVNVRSLKPFVHELRVTKSDAEIECMKKAGDASGTAFTQAMGHQFETEKELDAFLDYGFKSLGCEEAAYVPVIAGGEVRRARDGHHRLR